MEIPKLCQAYARRMISPAEAVAEVFGRIEAAGEDAVWINRLTREEALCRARFLEALPEAEKARLPLYGMPFGVKDCIDVAGIPTTCACPEFSYAPDRPAASVEKLIAARAIFIGKTNMDQFATGLVGTRSPYGTPRNRFNAEYLPGGSSSGSAVAVAAGLVSFTLGTDTGGSGRVPASYTNTVGLKPMPGKVSPRGLVNPCRSINCITVYALTGVDAMEVLDVIAGYEPDTPFSRPVATVGRLYSKADIAMDPLGPNFNHGHYTNFANPLDLTAVAAPAGFVRDNMPAGVTLLAPPHGEAFLTSLADIFSRMRVDRRGAV